MNPEKLHDAMNLLDEDLITPVEQLRRRRSTRWYHLGALAACLAAVCMLGLYGAGLFDGAETGDTAQELGLTAEVATEAMDENWPDRTETIPQSVVPEGEGVDQAMNIALPSAVLRIDRVEGDRFIATVLQSEGTLAKGDSVTVLLTQDTLLSEEDGEEAFAWPVGELPFAEGAVVKMDFVPGPEKGIVYAAILSPAQ